MKLKQDMNCLIEYLALFISSLLSLSCNILVGITVTTGPLLTQPIGQEKMAYSGGVTTRPDFVCHYHYGMDMMTF